jgi:hypothetical protein
MDNKLFIFACGVCGVALLFLAAIVFLPIPETGQEHSKTIAGFLMGVGLTTILNYYYGSSKGSADKNDLLKK